MNTLAIRPDGERCTVTTRTVCLLVGFSHFTTAAPNDCRTAIAAPHALGEIIVDSR
ncbi:MULTISPECIES: hypothetical protein [Paraburkholderia]|uniref:Uncharacterized protein n=1 Tax=Paraburkholderia unamae TaxID=219649 RepID=A0ACC6RFB7_9BURK